MIPKATLLFLLGLILSSAKEIPLAQAAQELSPQLKAGGIVTFDGTTFSQTGTFLAADVPPEKRLFEIGSISKVFNGLLLAQAVVEKKVTLDTPISALIGDLKLKDPKVGQVTLRQLACHTSGLPRLPGNLFDDADQLDPYAHYDRDHLNQALESLTLEVAPPQKWSYSNFAAGLLGDLLSRLYKKPWEDLVREKITTPLKMTDTVITLNNDQKKRLAQAYADDEKVKNWHFTALAGAGSLRSTATDLHLFGKALLAPDQSPFPAALKLLIESHSANEKHGLAIQKYTSDDQKIMGHNGGTGGYRSQFEVIPATQKIRIILINNTTLDPSLIIRHSKGKKLPVKKEPRQGRALSEEKLAEFPGVYLLEKGPLKGSKFTVVQRGKKLFGKLTGQQYLQFHAAKKEDRFFLNEVKAEFQFDREDGKISTLTLFQNGQEFHARLTDEKLPKEEKPLPLSKKEAAEYLGNYQLTPDLKFTITYHDETLMARLTGQPSLAVIRKKKDRFEYQAVEAALEFERDKDGKVIAVKLHQNGIVQRAAKND